MTLIPPFARLSATLPAEQQLPLRLARMVLRMAESLGVELRAEGEMIYASPPEKVTAALGKFLALYKPQLLLLLR